MSSGAISNFSCAMLADHQDHDGFPILYDHKDYDALNIFLGQSEIMSPIPVLNSLPETSGILGMDLPTLMDYKMGHIADIAKTQDFHDGIQLPAFVGMRGILGEFIHI
jgi:hypothetical protein